MRGHCILAVLLGFQTAPTTGDAIIRAMHDRYANTWYHSLTFSHTTSRRTPADTMVSEVWNEEALFPGRLRVDIQRPGGPVSGMYVGDSLYVWRGDSMLVRAESYNILLILGFDVYTQPPESTLAMLHRDHYSMSPVREDLWEGRSAYVIGDGPHQLWIDKERLLLVRAIEPHPRDSTKSTDLRLDHYVAIPSGWIAETIEIYSDGKLMQHEEYRDVRPNAPVDPRRFTRPAAKPPN